MTYSREKLPDGTVVVKHYENNELVLETHGKTSPSGMEAQCQLGPDGAKKMEMFSYGDLDIGLQRTYFKDQVEEIYFVKRKLASRKKYEEARVNYSDMPAPATELEDIGGELVKLARREREERSKARKQRKSQG